MKQEILEAELQKLYPKNHPTDLKLFIQDMIVDGWIEFSGFNYYVLYKKSYRLHCGKVIIIDTLISNKKGEGSKVINWLKKEYPDYTIQLDCAVDNTAIEFYKKQGFKHRANSLILTIGD